MSGIFHITVELPKARLTAEEMASKVGLPTQSVIDSAGVHEKPVLTGTETWESLADRAAQRCLDEADVSPSEVGLILAGGLGPWTKQMWSPAAYIQNVVGARRAFAFDLFNGCNTGNLALEVASQFLNAHPEIEFALIVTIDTPSRNIDYSNIENLSIFNFSDAAAAVLIKRDFQKNKLLGHVSLTNADFVNDVWLNPKSDFLEIHSSDEQDRQLSAEYKRNYISNIQSVCKKAGFETHAIDHLFMNQGDFKLIRRISDTLEIGIDKIEKTYSHFGHMGNSDIFFGWMRRQREERITPGQKIVLAASSVGYSWGATAIEA